MTPRTRKRASIFPAYTPPASGELPSADHLADYIDRLAKRVLTIGSLLAVVAGAGGFLGIRVMSPRDITLQTEARFKAIEDTVRSNTRRLTAAETIMANNLYISCEVLARIQPGSIPPKECRR
jgi:hypothetical protein